MAIIYFKGLLWGLNELIQSVKYCYFYYNQNSHPKHHLWLTKPWVHPKEMGQKVNCMKISHSNKNMALFKYAHNTHLIM